MKRAGFGAELLAAVGASVWGRPEETGAAAGEVVGQAPCSGSGIVDQGFEGCETVQEGGGVYGAARLGVA
ncbi:MAG: hypothetical protein AAGJ32_11280, partial [Pseudomonadota bacterium]